MDEYYSVIQFLPEPLRTELKGMPPECAACVQEIRLRAGQAVQFTVGGAWQPAQQLLPVAQTALAIGPRMLRSCFAALCRDSAYAYEDELKQGYFSYAMANAHPDLKAISNFETLSNDEDGVLYIIRQLIHSRQ